MTDRRPGDAPYPVTTDRYVSDIVAMQIPGATAPPNRFGLRWLLLVLGLVLVAAVVSVLVVIHVRPESGPAHPKAWDPLVAPYVDIVEEQRGLTFDHPVFVDLLDTQEFRQQLTSRGAELITADTAEIDRNASMLQALGLAPRDLDLFNDADQLRGTGVLGYYSYADERITLRGTELTPAIESVLVRELTHALEDQSFDVGARWPDLTGDPARRMAVLTLVEGDVDRVQTAWRESLTPEALQAIEEDDAKLSPSPDAAARVPTPLKMLVGIPREFGAALLAVVDERRGDRAIDDLFLTPPVTQEQLLDPWALVQDHQGTLIVPEPDLADGEERLHGGTFGAITWLVMLAERLPAARALEAADGWGGDAYVAFERDGAECVKVEYAGDTPEDLAQMKTALRDWVKASAGSASVRTEGRRLAFQSCSQGRTDTATSGRSSRDAVDLAVARSNLSVIVAGSGPDVFDARCTAERLAHELPAEQLAELRARSPEVRRALAVCQSNAPVED